MALNKKIKSSLLVATIVAGGLYIGIENASLAQENKNLQQQVVDTSDKLKQQESENKELDKKIKESEKELEATKKDLEETKTNLDKTKTDLNNTKTDLDNTKTKLKKAEEQLQAKQQSNVAVATASTSNSLARPSVSNNTTSTTSKGTPIKITMTFYGSNIDGMSDMTASGKKVTQGCVASNYYPFGTKFEYNGQIYTVMDRGGKGLNGPNNLDIYVPRKAGESDSQYRARLYQLGRKTVTMNKL